MSNYLVDGADLTDIADAIRAKGGTSGQLQFPQGFVDAVEAIETGGGSSWTDDIARITISLAYGTLPSDVTMDFPNATVGITQMLRGARGASGATEVTINALRIVGLTSSSTIESGITNLEQSASDITQLTLNSLGGSHPEAGSQFLYNGSIQRVLGTPLIAYGLGGTGSSRRFNSTSLREFYLVPNKISASGGVNTGVLVDASLVSVANALKGGLATAQTITISNATTKAKCSTIMGTVSQVTDGDETYDFFTQDQESGTVTLAEFITNVKGWTLA